MQTILSEIFAEAEAEFSSGKVRQFYCDATDHQRLENYLQMSVADQTLADDVASAVGLATSWVNNAMAQLRVSPRSARTVTLFRNAFAQNPDWNPAWKTRAMRWIDWGDLIAEKLGRAASILNGGNIKFYCYGNGTHCGECTDNPPTYYACSSWGKQYVICLGNAFWDDWRRGDFDSMASTLLHESLHIYFGQGVAHAGRSKNASCYQRFVSLINNRAMPSRLAGRCPSFP